MLSILFLAASIAASSAERPNVLIITLDTTRADHIGCYGRKPSPTPVLDELASQGALFEQAHSHIPLTLPSHAVLMTGQLPSTLGLHVNGDHLRDGVATLAAHLKSSGYWTGAVVASVILNREYGLARGIAVYDDHMTLAPRVGDEPEERRADEVTETALAMAATIRRPFFLWTHYYDAHYQYRPPAPYAQRFQKQPYDGEIAYMDASIGELLRGLRHRGLLKDTLIVIAADHGEGLGERGEKQHGVFLYEYALHVPLLFIWESHIHPGVRIPALCGLVDVTPTILDLMNAPSLSPTDGVSLKPLLEGHALPPRQLYAESYQGFAQYGWAPLRALISESWKYIDAPQSELYAWRVSEEKNVIGEHRDEVRAARAELKRYPQMAGGTEPSLTDETRKRLMSLGYISGATTRAGDRAEPDPKEAIAAEEDLARAREALDAGENERAKKMLRTIVAQNGRNLPALAMLGLAHLADGEYDEAKQCFESELRIRPDLETAHLHLGTVYKRTGQLDSAVREYAAVLAISPRNAAAAANLAQVYLRMNRSNDAARVLRKAIDAGGQTADVYFEVGVVAATEGNLDEARRAFTQSLSLDPNRHEALANLGKIAFRQGRIDESISNYERASRAAPRNSGYLATLGSLYLERKDDADRALQYFRRAVAVDPYGVNAADLRRLIAQIEARRPQ